MKICALTRHELFVVLIAAILAGCAAGSSAAPPVGGADIRRALALSNPVGLVPAQRIARQQSWISPQWRSALGNAHKLKGKVLWGADLEYGALEAYDYKTGALIGEVPGFSYPYGLCSDSNGDVYVSDFSNEEGAEIQAGTFNIIKTWPTGGEAIGCSVSKSGDVSFTNFYPGGVVVFPGGGPTGTTYSGPGYDWPAGYDKNGSLFVECNYVSPCSSPHLAELVSGSWQFLNFDQSIAFPAAVQGGAPDIGVADQNYNFADTTAIYWTSISGSNAHAVRTYNMEGSGCSSYMDDSSSWGSLAKQHANGVQIKKVKGVAAANLWCFPSPINIYGKKGGTPASTISVLTYQYDYGVTFTSP